MEIAVQCKSKAAQYINKQTNKTNQQLNAISQPESRPQGQPAASSGPAAMLVSHPGNKPNPIYLVSYRLK